MDHTQLPVGFSMALAQNSLAMERFATLSQSQKKSLLTQARQLGSEREMHLLVDSLARETEQN